MKKIPVVTYHKVALERLAINQTATSNLLDEGSSVIAFWNWESVEDGEAVEKPCALTVYRCDDDEIE